MALRNLGRRRARTTATLLALFIGVYGIGVDIAFGQDLGSQITSSLAQNSPYNLVATTVGNDRNTLSAHLNSIAGLELAILFKEVSSDLTKISVKREFVCGLVGMGLGSLVEGVSPRSSSP